jgi:hypothetical protein
VDQLSPEEVQGCVFQAQTEEKNRDERLKQEKEQKIQEGIVEEESEDSDVDSGLESELKLEEVEHNDVN